MRLTAALLLVGPGLLFACKASHSPPAETPAPPPPAAAAAEVVEAAAEPATLADDMRNHWDTATSARDALIHGDLAGARLWGRGLAERKQPEALPPNLRPLYAEMQVAADAVGRAGDIPAAGAAIGALAITCSECHDFTGAGPRQLLLPLPEQDFGSATNDMPLHKWSSDWMWIGLIADDGDAWKRGAEALEQAPFAPRPGAPRSEVGLEQMEHIVHLGPSLADPEDRAQQGQRYGMVITACAMCHSEAEDAGLKSPGLPPG